MKKFAKKAIKVICFICIFSLLFAGAQFVLHYRWSYDEDIYTRNIDYSNQPANSIDVLYFGTSEVYAGVAPIVTYGTEGITGYNFAVTYKSAVTTYYQLLYALKYQTPKVVVCDFASLYSDSLPSDVEPLYRKIYETMPDKEIKEKLLEDIYRLDSSQDKLYWEFPLLRYHSLWSELHRSNFKLDNVYDEEYKTYHKGCMLCNSDFKGENYPITKSLWKTEESHQKFSDISIKYYDMFIKECQTKGIKVVAVNTPKIHDAKLSTSRYYQLKSFFNSRNVEYLNYNTYENVKKMNLNFLDHYYNDAHLNISGAVIFSKTLAKDLMKICSFEDHRKEEDFINSWGNDYKLFQKDILGFIRNKK